MAWGRLSTTTLASAGNTISSGTITAKKFNMILYNGIASGTLNVAHRCNGDSGSNYAKRYSTNGSADTAGGSNSNFLEIDLGDSDTPEFAVGYLINISTEEKLGIMFCVIQNTAGAANAPKRVEAVGKWANTSVQMTMIDTIDFGSGTFDTNSNQVVIGTD